MKVFIILGVALLGAIGLILLPVSRQEVTEKWWLRGAMLWVILASIGLYISSRQRDLDMFGGTDLLAWAGFFATTYLVSMVSVMVIWPQGSKSTSKWRLELGMFLAVLSGRLAWVLW